MSSYRILQAEQQGVYILKFVGEIRLNLCSTLDAIIESMSADPAFRTVVIDLTEAQMLDSTSLGLLAKLAIFTKSRSNLLPTIISTNPDVTRLILSMGFDRIFIIVKQAATQMEHLNELPILDATEKEVREKVLAAHRVLMELNEQNRTAFKDLVAALECDGADQGTPSASC